MEVVWLWDHNNYCRGAFGLDPSLATGGRFRWYFEINESQYIHSCKPMKMSQIYLLL